MLRDTSGVITRIEPSVFDAMKLGGVVLLEEDPVVIVNRLRARDNQDANLADVVETADAVRDHARDVTTQLGVALITITSPTLEVLTRAIATLLAMRVGVES